MPRQRLNTWPENEAAGSEGAAELSGTTSWAPSHHSSVDSADDDDVPLLFAPASRRAVPPPSGSYDVTAICRVAPLIVDLIFVGVTTAAYMAR